MRFSGLERRAGSCPTVAAGIVSPASVSVEKEVRSASPYDHFSAGPDRCVKRSPCGRVDDAGGCPAVVAGIISPAGVQRLVIGAAVISAPDNHLATSPHRRVRRSGVGRIVGAGGYPSVGAGMISAPGVENGAVVGTAPDNHLAAGPDCRVIVSSSGRVGQAGGDPTIRAGIVSPAGVQIMVIGAVKR